jgi:hypothetical protein
MLLVLPWFLLASMLTACGTAADAERPVEFAATMTIAIDGEPVAGSEAEAIIVSGSIVVTVDAPRNTREVRFHLDGETVPLKIDSIAPFDIVLDTTLLRDGRHVITATAAVNSKKFREIARVAFIVANEAVAPDLPVEEPPVEPDPPAPPTPTHWRPQSGLTWYWQLSGTIDTTRAVDVYDIDYQVAPSVVAALHHQGKRVIAYVPVGDWEPFRPDASSFPAESLCGDIPGWPERYIDVRNPTAVSLIKARIALAAASGFDGIEGDVVDLHLVDTGCSTPITEAEMTAFLRDLAAYANSLGLAYFAKNVSENAASWSTFTDGVVVEEAYQYGEAAAYAPYILANKPVFAVEYGSRSPTSAQCADANARGYALYGTDLGLTGKVYGVCW